MASNTPNLNLTKPAGSDSAAISILNGDMDILDAKIGPVGSKNLQAQVNERAKSVNNIPIDENGNIPLSTVEFAHNLTADDAQSSTGEFIIRTTGGMASLSDGPAWLSVLRGCMVHTGYVPESISMAVTLGERELGEAGITATLDRDTFVAYVNVSGTTTLEYENSAWSENPVTYGVTVTGTPADGDTITITYVKEERGTITVADPSAFISTGWNLYNAYTGYARCLKYSEDYGFAIEGTYTSLAFSATLVGTRTEITPVDGYFTVPGDGYVWVTGGNGTDTAVYMTWSNWTDGHDGEWEAYTESEIDLSGIMSDFPYGLMQVGNIRDEIDFNTQTATSNIQRMAYTASNLNTAKQSGRGYEYDEYYIYLVRETPETYSFDVSGAYTASDHGIEFFKDTAVNVYASTLYGQNLKDKLRSDVLTISAQDLSAAQSAQARANIGARVTVVSGTISSSALTITNAAITSDMVVVGCTFGSPGNVYSNLAWTSANGSITFTGTLDGSTTVVLYMEHSDTSPASGTIGTTLPEGENNPTGYDNVYVHIQRYGKLRVMIFTCDAYYLDNVTISTEDTPAYHAICPATIRGAGSSAAVNGMLGYVAVNRDTRKISVRFWTAYNNGSTGWSGPTAAAQYVIEGTAVWMTS